MSKQTKPINGQCMKRLGRGAGRCVNDATIGVYRWSALHPAPKESGDG